MSELKTRIQLRHDTEENWRKNGDSLVPLAGEACLTTDGANKGKVKYGDGTSTWNQLQYSGGPDVIEVDASNVTFDENMTFTYPFGKYTPGSDGQVTIPSTGKTLENLLKEAFAEEKNPKITQPSVSISSSQVKAYEAGTNVTISYNASLNPGKYEFGPATGIAPTTWSVVFNGETLTTDSGTFNQYQVEDGGVQKVTATAEYAEGAIPKTNLGNDYEVGKIVAGSKSSSTGVISGYRQIFYGVKKDEAPIDSAVIRSLTPGNKAASATTVDISAGTGAKQIVVAVPKTSGLKVKQANITTSLNADVTNLYVKKEEVQVEGANGFTAVPYEVFVYQPASIDASEVHKVVIGK